MTVTSDTSAAESLNQAATVDRFRPARSKTLLAGFVVIAVIASAALAVSVYTIGNKQTKLAETLQSELELLSQSRAEIIATWLEGTSRLTERIVESELLRLFATEMDMAGGSLNGVIAPEAPSSDDAGGESFQGPSLAEQLPYMEQVVTDFVSSVNFFSGHLIGRNQSLAYVASAGAPALSAEQIALAESVMAAAESRFGPARDTAQGLVIDLVEPVAPAQGGAASDHAVAAFIFTFPIAGELGELLAAPPKARPGERLRLLQQDGDVATELAPGLAPAMRQLQAADPIRTGQAMAFGRRQQIGGEEEVYSAGAPVKGTPLLVVQEFSVDAAEASLRDFGRTTILLAFLLVGAVVAAFGAFWWRLANEHNKARAAQFKHLAGRIDAQKRLLDSINNSIDDSIGLKGADGTYRYVNPAFARTVGRPEDRIIGMDDAALFGAGTAQRLRISDEEALASGACVTVDEQVYIKSKKHHLQISKVPFDADQDQTGGLVSVTRDITDLVEQREKKERAIEQMVTALVRAVELRDPYLGGHSRRTAGLAAEVSSRLGTDKEVTATIEIAANLSQIGKLAVPRELLTKPERLDPSEIAEVKRHIEHARVVLQEIDFGLPVLETIVQMHERLDGKGYPLGLAGDEISFAARILGVCDVFCARVEPRSYRAGIPPEEALEILAEMPERYDADVVCALKEVVLSVAGEKLLCGCYAA